jgi:hypothetical protein
VALPSPLVGEGGAQRRMRGALEPKVADVDAERRPRASPLPQGGEGVLWLRFDANQAHP